MAAKAAEHGAPKRGIKVGTQLAAYKATGLAPGSGACLGYRSLVAAGQGRRRGLAAIHLPVDGRSAEPQLLGNLRPAELGLKQSLDRHPGGFGEVRVVGSHLGGTLQVVRCRTSNLNPPSCVLAVQDLASRYDWFTPSVRDIRMLRIEENNDLMPAVKRGGVNSKKPASLSSYAELRLAA